MFLEEHAANRCINMVSVGYWNIQGYNIILFFPAEFKALWFWLLLISVQCLLANVSAELALKLYFFPSLTNTQISFNSIPLLPHSFLPTIWSAFEQYNVKYLQYQQKQRKIHIQGIEIAQCFTSSLSPPYLYKVAAATAAMCFFPS